MDSIDGKNLFAQVKLIENQLIQNFVTSCLKSVPKYFWEVPASSSGKYHPESSLGKGGLIRHTIIAVEYGIKLCEINSISSLNQDKIIAALILHDTCKAGCNDSKNNSNYPFHHHLPKRYFKSLATKIPFETYEEIFAMIKSHMGQWFSVQPESKGQKIVHYADYLASRKNQPIKDFAVEIRPLLTYDHSIILEI